MLKKIIKIGLGIIILVGLIAFGVSRTLDVNDIRTCDLTKAKMTCPAADAVVVISGGDTKARTEYGASLVKAELAPILIVSGASRQEGVQSNAEEMKKIAIDNFDLYPSNIITETSARNTNQNAKLVKEIIDKNNQDPTNLEIRSIILVTSGYHQKRAYHEFRNAFGPEWRIVNAPVVKDVDWSDKWYLTIRGWDLALKEVGGLLLVPKN